MYEWMQEKYNDHGESWSKKDLALHIINPMLFEILNASSMKDFQPKEPPKILYWIIFLFLDY